VHYKLAPESAQNKEPALELVPESQSALGGLGEIKCITFSADGACETVESNPKKAKTV
jgi:hypothetical protein